jgi:hypothetical protein
MQGYICSLQRKVFPLLLSEWCCCTQTVLLVDRLPSHLADNLHSVIGIVLLSDLLILSVHWLADDMWL